MPCQPKFKPGQVFCFMFPSMFSNQPFMFPSMFGINPSCKPPSRLFFNFPNPSESVNARYSTYQNALKATSTTETLEGCQSSLCDQKLLTPCIRACMHQELCTVKGIYWNDKRKTECKTAVMTITSCGQPLHPILHKLAA